MCSPHSLYLALNRSSDFAPLHSAPTSAGHTLVRRKAGGFTLVELLAVIGIVVLMSSLVGPAFNSIQGGKDIQGATSEISGVLEQARAYAMANNTFVYVGLQEVDAAQSDSAIPQVDGKGRVAAMVVASIDGTRQISTSSQVITPGKIVAITKVRRFENARLAVPKNVNITLGQSHTKPPVMVSDSTYDLTTAAFNWPLNSTPTGSPKSQYSFKKVIEFDPQGIPRSVVNGSDTIATNFEVYLFQTKGNLEIDTAANPPPQSAILLDGITGAVQIYRP